MGLSKISTLAGKSRMFKIGEIELEIKPRTLKDIDLIMALGEKELNVRSDAMKELIKRTLKDADKDASDEEINQVALRYFAELSKAIVEVNGLNVPE